MTNYKITMEAQSEIEPADVAGLLDYLLGGAMRITFLAVDKIGSDDS